MLSEQMEPSGTVTTRWPLGAAVAVGDGPTALVQAGSYSQCQPDVIMDDNYGEIQVVMTPGIQGPFREWLASRGLYLFPLPVEDELPTYGIGIRGGVDWTEVAEP